MREGDFKAFEVAGKEGRSKEIGTQVEMKLKERNFDCEVPYRRGELIKEDQVELIVREKNGGLGQSPDISGAKAL